MVMLLTKCLLSIGHGKWRKTIDGVLGVSWLKYTEKCPLKQRVTSISAKASGPCGAALRKINRIIWWFEGLGVSQGHQQHNHSTRYTKCFFLIFGEQYVHFNVFYSLNNVFKLLIYVKNAGILIYFIYRTGMVLWFVRWQWEDGAVSRCWWWWWWWW